MLVDGVWVPATLKSQKPDLEYGIALVPYNDANAEATNRNLVEGGWGYAIPTGSKHVAEAWEFLKYVTMGEGNLNFFKAQVRPSRLHRSPPS
jgi:multiple sugar transport system substrate-binding protein